MGFVLHAGRVVFNATLPATGEVLGGEKGATAG